MSKVALIVIYNHQYIKNIHVIEKIYKNSFSNIYHLMPFYTGDKMNVIPVYGNSLYFQSYISQGFKSFFKEEFDYYFFIADDLILNPSITEKNYTSYFNLNGNNSFLSSLINLHEVTGFWNRVKEAYQYTVRVPGVEIGNLLPEYEEAIQLFKDHNLKMGELRYHQISKKIKFSKTKSLKGFIYWLFHHYKRQVNKNKRYKLPYPLVGGYSDIVIVHSASIKLFCHYSGIFSSTNLFVELGIPTSLVFSAKKITTEKELAFQGKALWSKEESTLLDKYQNKLSNLLTDFPKDYLYIHPIKLSAWTKNEN